MQKIFDLHAPQQLQSITLGGGCFWCTQAVFSEVPGVLSTEVGYCNGHHASQPSYAQVCQGDTGYNEVVQLHFDANQIGIAQILQLFFTIHDPTTLNQQGNDRGTQYRSGIYYSDAEQRVPIEHYMAQLHVQQVFTASIVTEVLALQYYWKAEDYHQHYFAKNPNQGYCAAVIPPKLEKLRKALVQM